MDAESWPWVTHRLAANWHRRRDRTAGFPAGGFAVFLIIVAVFILY